MKLTANRAQHLFKYNPLTGVFLWVNCPSKRQNGKRADNSCGSHGYRQIYADGHVYVAHRVAWLYMKGKWPAEYIDHANCIKIDNRFCNLREATQTQQNANARRRWNNQSGFKGVDWKKSHNAWRARISSSGHHRLLGYFKTAEAAHAAYATAAHETFGEFARIA